MKYAFYSMLKALFVLEIFTFLSWLFGYVEKRLGKKAKVNYKIYGITDCTQITTIHILGNISRSKGNQAIKFGPLIEYSMRNFFKKSIRKMWWRS